MRARLEFKKQFSNSNINKIEGMNYLDELMTIIMKRQCMKVIKECKKEHKYLRGSPNVGYVLRGV